jgi:hypothetical protein
MHERFRFYFTGTSIGKFITSSDTHFVENIRKYLMNFYKNTIDLNRSLKKPVLRYLIIPAVVT